MNNFFKQMVNVLKLGNLVSNPSRVSGGLTHRMYLVETDKGKYVVKLLNKNIMKKSNALDNFSRSEELERILEKNNIPCIYSLEFNGKKMQKIENQHFYVFEYYDGKILKRDISTNHVIKIGKVMAQIHNIDVQNVNALTKMKIDFKYYIDLAKEKNSVIYEYIYDKLDILNEKLDKSNEAVSKIDNISCICHNDIDPKNVMWKDDDYKIIDLECLCYSNPYKELFEIALCWSGYEECNVNLDLFKEFIKSYAENTKINMNIDWEQIYYTNNGSLGWLEYNIKRALELEEVDEEEKELGISEVKETIAHIMYYNDIKDMILETIYEIIK